MTAIFKREIKSYFSSPVGYVCVAGLSALYGFFYFQLMLTGSSSYISSVFSAMFLFAMMIIPIITMKSMSEDRKNKTDQAYLTAPVSVTGIVVGKFLAAFAVYALATAVGSLPIFAISTFASPPWALFFGNFIATLLYGSAVVAIGVFISSLTESQVIAAVTTFIIAMLLYFLDGFASMASNSFVNDVISWLSFTVRYSSFTMGLFSIADAVFFISVTAVFVFLTARKLESRRWG